MPLAIDLFCGLGGWTEGLLAEGYEVIGFDIERHRYPAAALPAEGRKNLGGSWFNIGSPGQKELARNPVHGYSTAPLIGHWAEYPGHLVIQDVLTLHGSQFKDAALIVASPPCQEYSYMAMPWKRAKAKAAAIRADTTGQMLADLNRLFDACFRIQAQASLAAGRHVPMVVENVRGAIPWVGRSRWNFGSFHLWGDVPALMPWTAGRLKGGDQFRPKRAALGGDPSIRDGDWATKLPGLRFDGSGRSFQSVSVGLKLGNSPGRIWSERRIADFDDPLHDAFHRRGSGTSARKAASAMIAKIPIALSRHIAATYLR